MSSKNKVAPNQVSLTLTIFTKKKKVIFIKPASWLSMSSLPRHYMAVENTDSYKMSSDLHMHTYTHK